MCQDNKILIYVRDAVSLMDVRAANISNRLLIFIYSCTVRFDAIKSHLLSNGCTIKYSKKNVNIYMKINIKMFFSY